MKNVFAALLFFMSAFSFAQNDENPRETINNYKFVIVPSKFSFLKEPDQYQLNMFTKMYLEKYGFKVFYDTDLLPLEAAGDNCNKMFADVVAEKNNMFVTKLSVTLRDCMNVELFRTELGVSREKEYKTAYRQALREAFKSFETLGYSYNGKDGIRESIGKRPMPVSTLKTAPSKPVEEMVVDKNTLFAQPVENGYQLVDTTPKVIFKIKKTSSAQVFLADKDGQTGTLIEKGKGKWVFEYYVDGKLMTEEVSIKF
ncbi:hypothetical protein HUK80_07830 [Flavobacterium sp. MAH-1]|uniref:Uncharacterized protein n=1 Tax=Flavobacterium agri TaxID=2743471 RepID=A0A7Y8Y1N2_9FLAO|nr:hypothetical protein [Flavobacterium agri]NUY80797.1 hypothetical protein [Flavobacterium agri]NYA70821.1 hypothetical protein [Flavobacterium agri]